MRCANFFPKIRCLIGSVMFLFLYCGNGYCQSTDYDDFKQRKRQEWATYKDSKQKAWADYRDKLNKDYAEKMSRQWTTCRVSAAKPVPKRPEPPRPLLKTDQKPIPTKAVSYSKYVSAVTYDSPQPFQPIAHPDNEQDAAYTFSFHSTPCKVHLLKEMYFSLPNVSESAVADGWRILSASGYDIIADDCLNYRDQLDLNDWGYIELVKCLSQTFFGESTNEAVLMQAYLLVQSGYKVRLARTGDRLVLMMPFTTTIYQFSFFILDDEQYYLMDDNKEGGTYYIFNCKFTGEKTASLDIKGEPRFFDEPTPKRTFSSSRYPDASAIISTNRNLMAFYNSCPVTSDWASYARASLSRKVKRNLYPTLKKHIAGKSELEAANILINFVQTAFDYKSDQDQFGYERPLFGDELFYYPYSDCEDRSILFSILVRDLLKLEVVLLNYPGHLATAVRFNEEVSGYYFLINGQKFVLCDPTYIGAPVGDCMPQYVGTSAVIVEIGN